MHPPQALLLPLDVVQIDHTPADVIVVDEHDRQPIGRPWLTLALDVASRAVLGFYVSLDAPSLVSVAMVLTNAVLLKATWLADRELDVPWPMAGPKEYLDAEDGIHRLTERPTYDQRPAAEIAAGAQPIKKKLKAVKKHELRLAWTPCANSSFENGVVQRLAKSQRADCFPTLEDAQAAEENTFTKKATTTRLFTASFPAERITSSTGTRAIRKKKAPRWERSAD
jgi:hypothetical protein